MTALAILGPRSRPQDLSLFQQLLPDIKVLALPTPAAAGDALAHTDLALIFGGDGTLHRHLNALVAARAVTLPVPSGSGNDFAADNGIRSAEDAAALLRDFLAGKVAPRQADLGLIRTADATQHFSCCANVGLDADATRRANALPAWLKARSGYLLGGLAAILRYQPQRLIVTSNGQTMLDAHAWFVAVTNTPIYGGGLPIAPQASIFDAQLDVTCLRPTPRWNVVRHYPKIMTGAHVHLPEILAFRATQVRIVTEQPQPIYSDGDYVGLTPCDITVAPAALRVLARAAA